MRCEIIAALLLVVACTAPQASQQPVVQDVLSSPEQPAGNIEELTVQADVLSSPEQPSGNIREFTIEAFQFSYDPATIEVDEGDTVRITATTRDVPHGLAIPAFGVNMQIMPGQTATAEFVADKPGTYEWFCSIPCGSGHRGMKGTLIVREHAA